MDVTALRERAADLPRQPGVYRFLDGDTVLYVGKAVDLRSRVRSYADPRSERVCRMRERADGVDVAVTDTETQALLLEANLIKRHQPRYNVRLKDDKSYPLIQLTDHDAPRIEVTRDPDPDAEAFGPYTEMGRVETVVKALRETYGIRGCSDHKYAGRERPCLDYEVGLCSAPCTGEIDPEDYRADVESVRRFLEGEAGVLADPIRREMEAASERRAFERAANLRDRLAAVRAFHDGAGAAVDSGADAAERTADVLGVAVEGDEATVARLRSEDGKLVERERHALAGGRETGAVLGAFATQFYAERELPDALLLPERPPEDVRDWLDREGVAVRVPGAGREATLVDLALKNARRAVPERDEGTALARALADAGVDVDAVERVEGFDVSHAQGRAVVGADVTFVDGSPEKSAYRRKKLSERNDDYANLRELVAWRARRALDGTDDRPEPDLLLIDGGEGQLEAACGALAETGWDVPAVGLAKREERVVTPAGTYDWPADAPQLHLLQRVRDEAHRFAVQYHETVRDEVGTVLDDVPGVGEERRQRLLGRFGSVANVRAASRAELLTVPGVGEATAERLKRRLSADADEDAEVEADADD
jgi:excinuclease ABC subunit C